MIMIRVSVSSRSQRCTFSYREPIARESVYVSISHCRISSGYVSVSNGVGCVVVVVTTWLSAHRVHSLSVVTMSKE